MGPSAAAQECSSAMPDSAEYAILFAAPDVYLQGA